MALARVLDGVRGTSPPSFFLIAKGEVSMRAEISADSPQPHNCNSCGMRAEIFQAEGDFCLQCWQKETHPRV